MATITCTKCLLTLEQSFFIKEKGGFYTRCMTCREQNNEYNKKRKKVEVHESALILNYEELDQCLSEMIHDIGQEEYYENCETGINFTCLINTSSLSDKTPKEIADNMKDFIGNVDGYYYM